MQFMKFELDLPYIPDEEFVARIIKNSGCNRTEATKQDYEANWKAKRREFALQTRCTSSFFERVAAHPAGKSCRKILVECISNATEQHIRQALGVIFVPVQFDYNMFISLDDFGKKKYSLAILMDGIRKIALHCNWSMTPFDSACSAVVDANYCNECFWQKSAKNPHNGFTAKILLQHEVGVIHISIVIQSKNGDIIAQKTIISELPDEYAYDQHLGSIKWSSNTQVMLSNQNNNKNWIVDVEPNSI